MTHMNKKSNRGGSREGSGRKKVSKKEKKISIPFLLAPCWIKRLMRLGGYKWLMDRLGETKDEK